MNTKALSSELSVSALLDLETVSTREDVESLRQTGPKGPLPGPTSFEAISSQPHRPAAQARDPVALRQDLELLLDLFESVGRTGTEPVLLRELVELVFAVAFGHRRLADRIWKARSVSTFVRRS
ncbi:MAG: hypothetical protein CL933_16795 [Deltaproteobacteria bacterium]|nr:hypothetical protein [Deltaproteobacteria bacterium]